MRGTCQVCGRSIALRQNGTLRGHGARDPYDTWCTGSWLAPRRQKGRNP